MSSNSPWPSPERLRSAPGLSSRRAALARGSAALAAALLPAAVWGQSKSPGPGEDATLLLEGLSLALRGSGTMRFWGLEVYTARLWVGAGFEPERYAQYPLALELAYARRFSARQIAQRSLQEMKRQQPIPEATEADWTEQLARTLPDVKPGDRLLGLHRPQQGAAFWRRGAPALQPLGRVEDARFSALFFGIWLSTATSEPALRAALLGSA